MDLNGDVRKSMLNKSFNLRAEVAAALLEREEDLQTYESNLGNFLSPSFSATYRVLDMSSPAAMNSSSSNGSSQPTSLKSTKVSSVKERERRGLYSGASISEDGRQSSKPRVQVFSALKQSPSSE